jgi:low affinity Fe/Cu permease
MQGALRICRMQDVPNRSGRDGKAPGHGSHARADWFNRVAFAASQRFGSPWAFAGALLIVVAWAFTGPLFGYSETWQLVINTSTTIVTFLMVFLIQSSQNRDAKALHLKLDELIRCSDARNDFADLEDATEEELEHFQAEFRALRGQGIDDAQAALAASRRARDAATKKRTSNPPENARQDTSKPARSARRNAG